MTVESARHESFLLSRVVFIRPVVRERVAYAARAGVRPRLGRRRGAGAAARPREPPPPLVHIVTPRAVPTGARSRAAPGLLRAYIVHVLPPARSRRSVSLSLPCLIIVAIMLT